MFNSYDYFKNVFSWCLHYSAFIVLFLCGMVITKPIQFRSVTQSYLTLCGPMNCSTPGLPVHHQLPEFTQAHIHRVSDAIQPSHPLSSPSPPAPNPSQHQSLPMSQLFAWGGQSTGVSALASFLPKKSQGWSPSEWTGWISLQLKGLSRAFCSTTVQKHQFFGSQPSSQFNSHIHTWPQEVIVVKVKVAQSCPTLCDPVNSPGQNSGVGSHSLFQGIFLSFWGLSPSQSETSLNAFLFESTLSFLVYSFGSCLLGCSLPFVKLLSCIWPFTTPWTVARQAPPSMGFSRQEYLSRLPFPSPEDLPDPGIEPGSPAL